MKVLFIFLFSLLASDMQAAPSIAAVRMSPATAVIGTPTQVTVQASITDPSLISGGVNLLQLNPDGSTTILGTLHDDGINGDQSAGDQVFTIIVTLTAPSATTIQLQVSAAFKGQLLRVRSSPMSLFFQPTNAPQQALASLAQSLASGDRTTALGYINPSTNATSVINTYSQQALNFLASELNAAILVGSFPDLRIFEVPVTRANGMTINSEFDMVPGFNGQWVINSW